MRDDGRYPFGNPDGVKAEFDGHNTFVRLNEREFNTGISLTETDRNIRIIVGKKGAGKTIYIRRLQDSARQENSVSSDIDEVVFASKIARDVPQTLSVIGFCQQFTMERVTEAWQSAWRIAILRSVMSHLAYKKYFNQYINQEILISKLRNLGELESGEEVERSPYSELKNILYQYRSESTFSKFAGSSKWDDIQTIIGTALKACPPVFIYMDAVDDEFTHAPMEWHRCQKGLFYAVLRLLGQSGAIGQRLHVVIAIRDIVYSSVMQSEHQTRYIRTPYISILEWDYYSITYFLKEKVKSIHPMYLDDRDDNSVESFLGLKAIENLDRKCLENSIDYVIRHTRCLPRDVVQMGNLIATEKLQYKIRNYPRDGWVYTIRNVVSQMAKTFAEEQLIICANQLASHDAPAHSVKHDYADAYVSSKEQVAFRKDTFKNYIKGLGCEKLSIDDLIKADNLFKSPAKMDIDLSTILWQNGLIGFKRRKSDEKFEFYSMSRNSDFIMPDYGEEYALHSIMLDAFPKLRVEFPNPVVERM